MRRPCFLLLVAVLATLCAGAANARVTVVGLKCEYALNPVGIDETSPRLSWMIESDRRGEAQTAYRILVASSLQNLAKNHGDLWDTGKVASAKSLHITYSGKPMRSRMRCFWKAQVWDKNRRASAYSAPAFWEMGLLRVADWRAKWIQPAKDVVEPETPGERPNQKMGPCQYVRKAFAAAKPVKRARLYISALGIFEPYVNGRRIGHDLFTPGWTEFAKRVQYLTYDVTDSLRRGDNVVGFILADGWYAGFIQGRRARYAPYPLAMCQLVLDYADGTTQSVVTDDSWKTSPGPLVQSDINKGETYDARLELGHWSEVGFDDSKWEPVQVKDVRVQVDAQRGPSMRQVKTIRARQITEPKPNVYVFDMGQNMVGHVRLKVNGPRGTEITLRHAEVLDDKGTGMIYTKNLRSATATDHYILKGTGIESYEPRFTFHGFRYVEVTGYPGRPTLDAITGVVVTADTPPAGEFACSDPMINKLQSNIVWGQRGNFLMVPTDCPQRDERLGWTGDAQIFIRTATFNADVDGFFSKWLVDMEDGQDPDGKYPDTAPRLAGGGGAPGWGDAGVVCPYTVYTCYGDAGMVKRQYDSMVKWVGFCKNRSVDLVCPAKGYGDWVAIGSDTPREVLSTAHFAHSTDLLSRMAKAIGRDAEAMKYARMFADIKTAFNKAFVAPDGRIKGDTQTVYAVALCFDLLPADKRDAAGRYLVEDVEKHNGHLTVGFLGVNALLPALTKTGHTDVAYRLLNTDTCPSWLHEVKSGATTIWERWDGWTKEKGFQDPGMNSFNHYAFGSVGEWMYENIAGIALDPTEVAYKRIIIRPRPGGGLTYASGRYDSVYGRIASSWRMANGKLGMNVTVPANTTATVYVPTSDQAKVTESGKPAKRAVGVKLLRYEKGAAIYSVGSGSYRFVAPQ